MSDQRGGGIAWCDYTFNPWWGCTKVSAGCDNCYAETLAKRFGTDWGPHATRREFDDEHWNEPLRWNRAAEKAGRRARVFCASMADVFDAKAPRLALDRLWQLIEETPWLDWLLLTKRIERAAKVIPWMKPRDNVWVGTSIEDQETADHRMPFLLEMPASVRFVSYEPALGPVNFHPWFCKYGSIERPEQKYCNICDPRENGINWVIVGGESGHGARPFDLEWARLAIAQCKTARITAFCKQLGACPVDSRGIHPDANPKLIRLHDRKGGDPEEWPEDLRVREFPH